MLGKKDKLSDFLQAVEEPLEGSLKVSVFHVMIHALQSSNVRKWPDACCASRECNNCLDEPELVFLCVSYCVVKAAIPLKRLVR